MPQRTLHSAYTRFASQTYRLVQVFCAPALASSCELPHVYSAQLSAIRLQMLWGQFCKRVIIESAIGNVLTLNGQLLSKRKGGKALYLDVERVRWHLPKEALKQAFEWRIENYNQITLGLAYAPADEVNRFRNYCMHPGKNSYGKLVSVLDFRRIPPKIDPYAFLSETLPGGISRFENWVEVMKVAAYESVK